jgi:hypothetical protein
MDGLTERWPNVEQEFFNDIEFLVREAGGLDLVLFTGDLTQRAKPEEFERVSELLEKLWAKFRQLACEPQFLAVPGNHDLVRPVDSCSPALLTLLHLWEKDEVQRPFWDNADSPQRELVAQAFNNYVQWWNGLQVPKIAKYRSGLLPGDFAATFEKSAVQLGIVGLNSAFLQLVSGNLQGRMALHVKQFNGACGGNGAQWASNHDLCLLLTQFTRLFIVQSRAMGGNAEA